MSRISYTDYSFSSDDGHLNKCASYCTKADVKADTLLVFCAHFIGNAPVAYFCEGTTNLANHMDFDFLCHF